MDNIYSKVSISTVRVYYWKRFYDKGVIDKIYRTKGSWESLPFSRFM